MLASHAGVFRGARGEGRNTSSPKKACVGGYISVGSIVTFNFRDQRGHLRGHVISIFYTILPGAFSQFSPLKPKVQTQRYFLLVYPVKHVPLLRQGLLTQGF